MAEEKIEIKIVLDDGSIQKGFATIETAAKKSGDKVKDSFGDKIFGYLKGRAESAAGIFSGISIGITAAFAAAALAVFAFFLFV